MKSKTSPYQTITIVGLGAVGRTIANLLIQSSERRYQINVIDVDDDAYGGYLDLVHAAKLKNRHEIIMNDQTLLNVSDYIFHCAGIGVSQGSSRLSTAKENIEITKRIFSNFKTEVDAKIIVIPNPVDIITYYTWKFSKLESSKVIGVGTLLDTIRMNYYVGQMAKNETVETLLLGEHGDSIVPIYSHSLIGDKPLLDYLSKSEAQTCLDQTIGAARTIRESQDATIYGIANCALYLLEKMHEDANEIIPLSLSLPTTLLEKFQCKPIAMSIPCRLGKNGAEPIVEYEYTKKELELLMHSANTMAKNQ